MKRIEDYLGTRVWIDSGFRLHRRMKSSIRSETGGRANTGQQADALAPVDRVILMDNIFFAIRAY
jgi:uncharacterized protein (DUF2342 family)